MELLGKHFSPLWQAAFVLWAEQPSLNWEFCLQERHVSHKGINKSSTFCPKTNLIRKLSLNLCTECKGSLWAALSYVNRGVQWHFGCPRPWLLVSMRLKNEPAPRALLGKCRPKWVVLRHLPEHSRDKCSGNQIPPTVHDLPVSGPAASGLLQAIHLLCWLVFVMETIWPNQVQKDEGGKQENMDWRVESRITQIGIPRQKKSSLLARHLLLLCHWHLHLLSLSPCSME